MCAHKVNITSSEFVINLWRAFIGEHIGGILVYSCRNLKYDLKMMTASAVLVSPLRTTDVVNICKLLNLRWKINWCRAWYQKYEIQSITFPFFHREIQKGNSSLVFTETHYRNCFERFTTTLLPCCDYFYLLFNYSWYLLKLFINIED